MAFAYVIGSKGKPVVKIGESNDPVKRLAGLQTGNPDKLTIIRTYLCDDGPLLEKWLKEQFKDDHHRGEWFTLASRIGDIDEAVRAFFGLSAEERQDFEDRQSDYAWHMARIYELAEYAEDAIHRAMSGKTAKKVHQAQIVALTHIDEIKGYANG